MAMRDCPLCYTRVFVGANGTCPACSRPIDGLAEAETVTMSLSAADLLPPFCATCAAPTNRRETVRAKRHVEGDAPWWVAVLALPISLPAALFLAVGASKAETKRVSVDVPRCEACGGRGALAPERVDFDEERVVVHVHREFRALVTGGRRG